MSDSVKHELHIPVASDRQSILDLLAAETGLSRQAIKQALDKGALWLEHGKHTRRTRRVKTSLRAGDTLHFYYDSDILGQQVADAELIADEGSYSIWYKPYGMYSQGSKWGDHCTITRNVQKQTGRHVYLVHRLDRAARGLMIIAHTKHAAARFGEMFQQRQVDKTYQAIVHGLCPASEPVLTINDPVDGKAAVSHVRTLQQDSGSERSLLEVNIETGRKHQIRRHLANAGYPIVGDRLYGVNGDSDDLQLCAWRLAFRCPDSGVNKRYQLEQSLAVN
jgi:tRNA pseudouridine32 synthase/23S rRNA pseudouridine746 synthase